MTCRQGFAVLYVAQLQAVGLYKARSHSISVSSRLSIPRSDCEKAGKGTHTR